jgi:hypothetical protein
VKIPDAVPKLQEVRIKEGADALKDDQQVGSLGLKNGAFIFVHYIVEKQECKNTANKHSVPALEPPENHPACTGYILRRITNAEIIPALECLVSSPVFWNYEYNLSLTVDADGYPTELLPVKKRPGTRSSGGNLDALRKDLVDRNAMNISVSSLNFYGAGDIEVIFFPVLFLISHHPQLHEDSTLGHLHLAIEHLLEVPKAHQRLERAWKLYHGLPDEDSKQLDAQFGKLSKIENM